MVGVTGQGPGEDSRNEVPILNELYPNLRADKIGTNI